MVFSRQSETSPLRFLDERAINRLNKLIHYVVRSEYPGPDGEFYRSPWRFVTPPLSSGCQCPEDLNFHREPPDSAEHTVNAYTQKRIQMYTSLRTRILTPRESLVIFYFPFFFFCNDRHNYGDRFARFQSSRFHATGRKKNFPSYSRYTLPANLSGEPDVVSRESQTRRCYDKKKEYRQ